MTGRKPASENLKLRIVELRKQGLSRAIIKERLRTTDWIITKTLQEYKQGEKEWMKKNY